MLVLSSSARCMSTLSVYSGSKQDMSKNSQHFSPTTSKSYYIVVLPFFFVKGVWPSLHIHSVNTAGASVVM